MKRTSFKMLLCTLFFCLSGKGTAQTDNLAVWIEKADYYLAHSQSEQKESFQAYVDEARKADANDPTAVENLKKEVQQYVLVAEPTDGIAFDVTFLLTNPEVSTSAEGWSISPTINYNESEFYNQAFDFYQRLTDMRAGIYRFNVTGFHRNGLYQDIKEIVGAPNAGCVIYGNEIQLPLLTLYYDATTAQFNNNTGNYANNMGDAENIFNKGFYTENAVMFQQDASGEMTVGLRNENITNGNWTCFRHFTLEYLGNNQEGKLVGAYRLTEANNRPDGAIQPGADVEQGTPLFHTTTLTDNRSVYWYMYEVGKRQYALRNVSTLQYITYDGQRTDGDYVRRYLDLTENMQDNKSHWTFESISENKVAVRNVNLPNHLFDLRTNSGVIGTYDNANAAGNNQQFIFRNAMGNATTEFSPVVFRKGIISLSIGGRELILDRKNDAYFCLVPEAALTANAYETTVDFVLAEGYASLQINGQPVTAGGNVSFTSIADGTPSIMKLITEDGDASEVNLYFTAMPIVQIYGNFGTEYTKASFRLNDPESQDAAILYPSKIRWRGASTLYRNKKQYAVKLYDELGESTDASFFGMRDDNNWILDGLAIDKARMRNRVVTDLWNDFGHKPYYFEDEPKALTGTRGHFVEVLLNDEYVGIYCLTEKIDRKQMKLKKFNDEDGIRGLLYKADDWSYSVFMGHNYDSNHYPMTSPVAYDNASYTWDGYEIKYPDVEDGDVGDWAELYNAVNFVATSTDEQFAAEVGEYFDLPVIVDYYILMEVILSADNHGKNMFWGVYNRNKSKKMTPALWDLDSTCGRRWDASEVNWEQDYTEYITKHEHGDFNLFRRLKACNVDNFNETVRKRYKQLRSGELSTENLLARFYNYTEMFKHNGAAAREENRWSNKDNIGPINFEDEMTYLTNWFTNRMEFLDEAFDIASLPDETPDGIKEVSTENDWNVYCEAGQIIVEAPTGGSLVTIHTIDGRHVGSQYLSQGKNHLGCFASGIYIVNKQKVVVP